MEEKILILVIGMARSGTSAITRVLSLCGCALPEVLMGSSPGNPTGHWEPINVVRINEEFLFDHESTWHDPTLRVQEELCISGSARQLFINKIRSTILSSSNKSILVIKDPRITALVPFWREAANLEGWSVKFLIPIRTPSEVVSSTMTYHPGVTQELSSVLWVKYNILAERYSRDLARLFIDHKALLSDWRREIRRTSKALSVDLDLTGADAVDHFIDRRLHRQKSNSFEGLQCRRWVSKIHEALMPATRDGAVDITTMDQLYEDYREAERSFRVAISNFRERFTPSLYRRDRFDTVPKIFLSGDTSS